MIEPGRPAPASEATTHLPPEPMGAPAWSSGAEPGDAAVVAEVLAGDIEAFAILVRRYRDSYTRFVVGMLGDAGEADDALHTAFVRAYRTLDRCPDPARFGAWLFRLVAAECATRAPQRASAGDRAATLAALSPDGRVALLLHHVEELSLDEMAELTGEAASSLRESLARAERRLRGGAAGAIPASARAPATLGASFGARVMDSVRVEARVRRRVAERGVTPTDAPVVPAPMPSWWRRPVTFTLLPGRLLLLAILVLAIAAAAVVGLTSLG